MSECPICSKTFTAEKIQEHASTCLDVDQLKMEKLMLDSVETDRLTSSSSSSDDEKKEPADESVDDKKEMQLELAEERRAKLTGEVLRVSLVPPVEFLEDAAKTHHYRFCENLFNTNKAAGYRLCSVEVIINPTLHKRYQEHKSRLQRKGQPVIESYTFHGTSKNAVDAIAKEGFALKRASYRLTLGPGVYSTESPDMAARYSKGSRVMLLTRICPCPRSRKIGTGSEHQIVVRTPEQIVPMYILHYSV